MASNPSKLSPKVQQIKQDLLDRLNRNHGRGMHYIISGTHDLWHISNKERSDLIDSMDDELKDLLLSQGIPAMLYDIHSLKGFFPTWKGAGAVIQERLKEIADWVEQSIAKEPGTVTHVYQVLTDTGVKAPELLASTKDALKKHLIRQMRAAILDYNMDVDLIKNALNGFKLIDAKVRVKRTDKIMAAMLSIVNDAIAKNGLAFDTRNKMGLLRTLSAENMSADIKNMVIKNKNAIIKHMLTQIKQGHTDVFSLPLEIEALRDMRLDWPELRVIERTINDLRKERAN